MTFGVFTKRNGKKIERSRGSERGQKKSKDTSSEREGKTCDTQTSLLPLLENVRDHERVWQPFGMDPKLKGKDVRFSLWPCHVEDDSL